MRGTSGIPPISITYLKNTVQATILFLILLSILVGDKKVNDMGLGHSAESRNKVSGCY
jgi:hypothetical protein